MSLGMEVGLGPRDFVLDGTRSPLPKRGAAPKFSAHVYCDQTAGWMKLVLGMVVRLSRGEFVIDGGPSPPPQKGQSPLPNFKQIGALPVIANFVALEQQIILVKTRSESV